MAQDKASKPDAFGRVFELKADMRQRDVAAWNRVYVAGPRTATADERQTALAAAIEAGWIVQPATRWEEVIDGDTGRKSRRYFFDGVELDDLTAAEVFFYGHVCIRHFQEIVAVPKVSSSR